MVKIACCISMLALAGCATASAPGMNTRFAFDRVSQIECRVPTEQDQERLNKIRGQINDAMEELKREQINSQARKDLL